MEEGIQVMEQMELSFMDDIRASERVARVHKYLVSPISMPWEQSRYEIIMDKIKCKFIDILYKIHFSLPRIWHEYCPLELCRKLHRWIQRRIRGWDYTDHYSYSVAFFKWLRDHLKEYSKIAKTYSVKAGSYDAYINDINLRIEQCDEMIDLINHTGKWSIPDSIFTDTGSINPYKEWNSKWLKRFDELSKDLMTWWSINVFDIGD